MAELERVDRLPALPARPAEGHKGTFGTVIVIGGSPTMIGAPAICANAALRTGTGLAKLAMDAALLPHAIGIEPSATGLAWTGSADERVEALDANDPKGEATLAVGPGLGRDEATGPLVLALLKGSRSVVLDADGLNLLAGTEAPRPGEAPLVMTPHPGEFKRLAKPLGIDASPTDPDQRPQAAAELARAHQAVVLLKGRQSVVSDGQRVSINESGNAALATAGTGDVLTGVIASLLGQGVALFDAAVLGAHLHGRAAERWARRHGRSGLLARELADDLPAAMEAERQRDRSAAPSTE